MKRMMILFVLASFLSGASFYACSNNSKADSEKGAIEKMTDKAAKEAVDRIRTQIEKAHSVKNQQADRYSAIEESLQK